MATVAAVNHPEQTGADRAILALRLDDLGISGEKGQRAWQTIYEHCGWKQEEFGSSYPQLFKLCTDQIYSLHWHRGGNLWGYRAVASGLTRFFTIWHINHSKIALNVTVHHAERVILDQKNANEVFISGPQQVVSFTVPKWQYALHDTLMQQMQECPQLSPYFVGARSLPTCVRTLDSVEFGGWMVDSGYESQIIPKEYYSHGLELLQFIARFYRDFYLHPLWDGSYYLYLSLIVRVNGNYQIALLAITSTPDIDPCRYLAWDQIVRERILENGQEVVSMVSSRAFNPSFSLKGKLDPLVTAHSHKPWAEFIKALVEGLDAEPSSNGLLFL